MYCPHDGPDADPPTRKSIGDSRVSSLSSFSNENNDEQLPIGVSAIVRPIYVHVNSMNTAASKHSPLGSEAVDGKAVHSNPLSSSRQEDAKGSFQNNLTSDQMYSMLQLESDDSDSASVITCTKEKSRNSKKQKKLTILDAIVGLKLTRTKSFNGSSSSSSSNKNKDRGSSHSEKAYLQRRNAALEEYMGPSSQVVPINKDHKKTIFKDNTRLLQTIQGHTGPIWTLKFSPDGHFLATGGQDGKLVVWTVGSPADNQPSPQGSRKGSDASGASNSYSFASSEKSREKEDPEYHDEFNSSFRSFSNDSERRASGTSTGAMRSISGNVFGTGTDSDRHLRASQKTDRHRERDRAARSTSPVPKRRSISPSPMVPVPIPALASVSSSHPTLPLPSSPVSPPGDSRDFSGKDGLSSEGSSRINSQRVTDSCDDINARRDDDEEGSGSFDRFEEVDDDDDVQSIPFICPVPLRVFLGHTMDVIDISWSKSHFILSASVDHNVRLWHATRGDCLQVFRHPDIATSVDFHPLHDRFFVSGCFDKKLRVWDIISDARTKEWVSLGETVTSVCFSSDGLTVVGGLMNGKVYFYNYEGLKYLTVMECRNRRGKFKSGSKVTGLSFYRSGDDNPPQGYPFNSLPPLLVTTNDNRLRLFSLGDFSLRMKFKGLKNSHMQIKANFSDDGKHIICGSEMGGIIVWETQPPGIHTTFTYWFGEKQDRNCSAEMIMNNSAASDPTPHKRDGLDICRLIGQRNKKRIQSAFQSLSRKNKSCNLNACSGFAAAGSAVATTTAIFAPVVAILYSSRLSFAADSSLCSLSASTKSVIPDTQQDTIQESAKGSSLLFNDSQSSQNQNKKKNRFFKPKSSFFKLGHASASAPACDDPKAGHSIAGECVSALYKEEEEDEHRAKGKGTSDVPKLDDPAHLNTSPPPAGKRNASPPSISPDSQKTDDAKPTTPRRAPFAPISDLSSRVIVATDMKGFIRVFVRSGSHTDSSGLASQSFIDRTI